MALPLSRRLAAALIALAVSGLICTRAAAAVLTLPQGSRVDFAPLTSRAAQAAPADSALSNVDYGGGPVMSSNANYVLAWQPAGVSYQPGYLAGVGRFFSDVAAASGSATGGDAVASQYRDATGDAAAYASSFAGTVTDVDGFPASGCPAAPDEVCLTDGQLEAELDGYLAGAGLPHDLAHEYFVLLPPSVVVCFDSAGHECSGNATQNRVFCSYHGDTSAGYVYATIPDTAGVPGCDPFVTFCPNASCAYDNGPADGVLSAVAHEHEESSTDPLPATGWSDWQPGCDASSPVTCGGEIGDKCNDDAFSDPHLQLRDNGAGLDTPYNETINGDHYLLQMMWSNQGHACVDGFTPGAVTAGAGFTESPGSGDTVNFDASSSSVSQGPARYVWQFDDGPGLASTVETTSPTIAHTFPGPGPFEVALTVMAADGTSAVSAATFVVGGASAPVPRFTFSSQAAGVGMLAFDASGSSDSNRGGTLVSYHWNFGDGSSATGAQTTHVFAHGGPYTITLTVIDAAGMQNSLSETVAVAGPPAVAPSPTPAPPVASSSRAQACRVPRLRGATLARARRRLATAGCRLGRIRRPRHAPKRPAGRGRRWVVRVAVQSLAPGRRAQRGAPVSVVVVYRRARA